MGPIAWANGFKKLLVARGVGRGVGARNDRTCCTVQQVAAEVGVPKHTAYRRLALASDLTPQRVQESGTEPAPTTPAEIARERFRECDV